MRLVFVVGARPNFMKMAPVFRKAKECQDFDVTLVHTQQHYDDQMSGVFLRDLGLPEPDVKLAAGSGSHGQQTARIMVEFERFLALHKADMVLVGGDVNSTLACALVASKLVVPVAHVEAGLRSFDRTMPEEINRVVTDALSDLLFTTSEDANTNLEREGIPKEKIFFVGNTMIDSLLTFLQRAFETRICERLGVKKGNYALLTLHRPSNVDDPRILSQIFDALEWVQDRIKLLFPAHPRTRKGIQDAGLASRLSRMKGLRVLPPLGYLDFLGLMAQAKLVLTDSGGIQEETTILAIPCMTLRWNTERPITIQQGTNTLVGNDPERITVAVEASLNGKQPPKGRPKLWDGKAARRIVDIIAGWTPVGGRDAGHASRDLISTFQS